MTHENVLHHPVVVAPHLRVVSKNLNVVNLLKTLGMCYDKKYAELFFNRIYVTTVKVSCHDDIPSRWRLIRFAYCFGNSSNFNSYTR